ncbi:MAG TPA: hypothetical protein VMI12_10740 [Puia sp.]|nr:hypothetical protein [Puia sp.]
MDQVGRIPEGVSITTLKIIKRDQGNIMHGMKSDENGYAGFGEAYFTFVKHRAIKGWKKHGRMTLNLVVPAGVVKFVLFDDRRDSVTKGLFFEITISRMNYKRLTVPPNIWLAFQGIGEEENIVLNIANIPHDPDETDDKSLDDPLLIYHNWLL